MKKKSIYGIISAISIIVRQFVLPNPFDRFGDKAVVINLVAEPIIQFVTFLLVGLVYQKRSDPGLGSFLFLLTYAVVVGILWILGVFRFAWWWILALVIVFVGLAIGIRWLGNKLSGSGYYE